ncbi:MAG: DUF4845 domain-containing protein [Sideroxyarcus sp.]
MKALAGRQRGISMVGMIFVAAGVILVAILSLKLVPSYMHSAQIAQILKAIADDPEMRGASIKEIKESYTKRADINYISDITADDLDINKENGQLSISASYSVKIPIAGNVTLLLEFNPSSS